MEWVKTEFMKLSSILLSTLVVASVGAEAQTEVQYTTTKKDTSKIIKCETAPLKAVKADTVANPDAELIKRVNEIKHACPMCGRG